MMFLLKSKVRGLSINHPLGQISNLPFKLEDPTLITLLKAGDSSVIKDLVYAHIRLAIHISGQYSTYARHKSHELVSESVIAIVESLYAIAKDPTQLKDDNLTGFLTTKIHGKLANFLRYDKVIRTRKNLNQKIISIESKVFHSQLNIEDIEEIINRSIRTVQEREIIDLRKLSMTYQEIADKLGLNKTMICKVVNNVESRFNKIRESYWD